MTQMSADVLILRQQEQQIQFFFFSTDYTDLRRFFIEQKLSCARLCRFQSVAGKELSRNLIQKFLFCGWNDRNRIEESDSARGILRLTEVSIDKLFDLRSSSVATRHSSSKLGSALAAPSFIMTTFVRRWSMVRNTISSSTLFRSYHPSESVQICVICGHIKFMDNSWVIHVAPQANTNICG